MARIDKKQYAKYLEDGLTVASPEAKAMIMGTCQDIDSRIDYNLKRLAVSPYSTKKFSGNLARSIHWAAWAGSGGDIRMCTFYVAEYIRFEEYAIQRGYKLSNGGKPAQISGVNYGRIAVDRKRGKHKLTRKAAPFFYGELLLHGAWLANRLCGYFSYTLGLSVLAYELGDQPVHDRYMQLQLAGYEMN